MACCVNAIGTALPAAVSGSGGSSPQADSISRTAGSVTRPAA